MQSLRVLLGKPKDLRDTRVFQHMTLAAFFAWVGLGADGLSSSAYGPEEAFRQLGEHTYLAIALAAAMAATVFILCSSYSRIIEMFPTGGGGYLVTSKLLGAGAGVVSGCALMVDYVLTISVSVAAGSSAIFAFLPPELEPFKLGFALAMIVVMIVLNLRGVKESVLALTPIFLTFLITHVVLIVGVLTVHLADVAPVSQQMGESFSRDLSTIGLGGMALIVARAYALGGGTYTGIEAISNGMGMMREPRVQTGKRTMLLMGSSLAFTAAGLLLAYLLLDLRPSPDQPMNATLAKEFAASWHVGGMDVGYAFVILTLLSEGALLFVAAQSGFVAGPAVLATMAIDSWFPRQFAVLSEQLTIRNGIYLMGGGALATLLYTRGDVHQLVVMYSINVFLAFTMSNLAMTRHWLGVRDDARRGRALATHASAVAVCATVLVTTSVQKFAEGGWLTIVLTSAVVWLAYRVRAHYKAVGEKVRKLDESLQAELAASAPPLRPAEEAAEARAVAMDPEAPTAVVLVGGYSGLGVHTLLEITRIFPTEFRQAVFISAAIVDTGAFKGVSELDALRQNVEQGLGRYVEFARARLGWAADYDLVVGTDAVFELERMCRQVYLRFPRSVFFAGSSSCVNPPGGIGCCTTRRRSPCSAACSSTGCRW